MAICSIACACRMPIVWSQIRGFEKRSEQDALIFVAGYEPTNIAEDEQTWSALCS